MNASGAEIRAEILAKVRLVEKVVRDLESKITDLNAELEIESHRLNVTSEYFRLEYGNIPHDEGIAQPNGPLFTMPKKFENATVREACRQMRKGRGGMHVAAIASEIEEGGRTATKNTVTSILVRGDEFGRTGGKTNTFYLIEDDSNVSP